MTARGAVHVQPAYADPDAVVALIRRAGPYWPLARYARSAEERTASGGGWGGGSFVPPWFRQDVALAGQAQVEGAELILSNRAFVDAAQQVFAGNGIVRPTTVYVNLMTPCTYPFIAHVDVPAFRGITRERYPVWLLHQMEVSGLFEPWRIPLATAGAAELTDLSIDADLRRRTDDAGWDVVDGGVVRARYDDADVRVTVSWKAEVFRDAEAQRMVDEHLDDLTLDQVTRTFAEDLARRAIPARLPDDPLHDAAWVQALAATYVERPPRIA